MAGGTAQIISWPWLIPGLLQEPSACQRPPSASPEEHRAQRQVRTRIKDSEEGTPHLGTSQGCPKTALAPLPSSPRVNTGGLYLLVLATGETGIQGQLLGRVSVWAELMEGPTMYICLHRYIVSLADLHAALPGRGAGSGCWCCLC